jgi:hypothetical protein
MLECWFGSTDVSNKNVIVSLHCPSRDCISCTGMKSVSTLVVVILCKEQIHVCFDIVSVDSLGVHTHTQLYVAVCTGHVPEIYELPLCNQL